MITNNMNMLDTKRTLKVVIFQMNCRQMMIYKMAKLILWLFVFDPKTAEDMAKSLNLLDHLEQDGIELKATSERSRRDNMKKKKKAIRVDITMEQLRILS